MGFTSVTTASDGQQALEELHRVGHPDAFDVILMDLHMPIKVGGTADHSRAISMNVGWKSVSWTCMCPLGRGLITHLSYPWTRVCPSRWWKGR